MTEKSIPEEWRGVVGYEGFYEVSNLGRVRSLPRKIWVNNVLCSGYKNYPGKVLREIACRNGYLAVNLTANKKRHQLSLHRSVLESFIGKCPDGKEACHNNGDRHDNRLSNLRWDTRKNNHADKKNHGTHQIGSANPFALLTEEQIPHIRKSNLSYADLAKINGVSKTTIGKVCRMETWTHV